MLPKTLTRAIQFLAALSAGAMLITRELNLGFEGFFIGLFLLGFLIEKGKKLSKFLHLAQPYLAFFFFLIAIYDFWSFSRSFLLAVAHFLMALQGLRLLSLRTVRDCLGSLFISSMMILSASTLSVEWSFFVFLSAFLPTAIWSLLLLNILAEDQFNTVAKKPDISAKRLALVAAGLSEEGLIEEKNGEWVRALPILKKATALAFVVSVSCCLFVFLVFPRFNFRGFRGQFLQPVHKSGFTNQVDLEKTSKIFQDSSIAMRIEINPQDRPFWPGYLRGSTLNLFDGKTWSHGSKFLPRPLYASGGTLTVRPNPEIKGRSLHQSVYLESMESPLLFAVPVPFAFKLDRPALMLREDGSFARGQGDTWRIHYEVTSILPAEEEGVRSPLSTFPRKVESGDLTPSLELPPSFDQTALSTLAHELTAMEKHALQKAKALETYLRGNFSYSLDLTSTRGENVLEKFLFVEKKGNCEYFASALCVMLRTLGIPSRMVTGFYAHEWNKRGGYYVVRMNDAHAWVEAYIKDVGWIQLDPTPRAFSEGAGQNSWVVRLKEAADYLNLKWNRYILSYDMQRQVQLFQSLNESSRQISFRFDELSQRLKSLLPRLRYPKKLAPFDFSLLSLWTVGLTGFFLLLIKKRRKGRNSVWFYDQLLRFLEKKGGEKPASKTFGEFVENLKNDLGDSFADVQFLIFEYYRRRFHPQVASPPESDLKIKQILKRIKV